MSILDRIGDLEERFERNGYRAGLVAEDCGVSERQLRRYIQRKCGVALRTWMERIRQRKVREGLRRRRPIKAISAEEGFAHPPDFSRYFKQHFHCAPHRFTGDGEDCCGVG
jgi:AraC-like DNA-binding protein